MSKERPILMSAPMVMALLENRKTQTRRIVKMPVGIHASEAALTRMQDGFPDGMRPVFGTDLEPNLFSVRNKYGQPGDKLWVKENFALLPASDEWEKWICYQAGGDDKLVDISDSFTAQNPIEIRAGSLYTGPWRPSIYCYRWASRITLEITSIRVERLNDISEEDAIAEGFDKSSLGDGVKYFSGCARVWYEHLWESINGKGTWAADPFVWVIEFKRV